MAKRHRLKSKRRTKSFGDAPVTAADLQLISNFRQRTKKGKPKGRTPHAA